MGPTIRFRGIYKDTETYVNMKYATDLDENDIKYIDVVKAPNDKYYMVKALESGIRSVRGINPIGNTSDWVESQNFEFIATDVLQANDAKVNFLSSNEVIIFDKDPEDNSDAKIVAGMTGGYSTLVDDLSNYEPGNNPIRIWAGSSSDYTEGL